MARFLRSAEFAAAVLVGLAALTVLLLPDWLVWTIVAAGVLWTLVGYAPGSVA